VQPDRASTAPIAGLDPSRRATIDYIDRTRELYLREGFDNPYNWARYDTVPFTQLGKPLAESTVGLVTTAAVFDPDKGDQGPRAPYNRAVKYTEARAWPGAPAPDMRISHLSYDRANTTPDDVNAYFPLAQLQAAARAHRVGSVARRFYAVPTLFSQRHTNDVDAPAVLRWCREDGVDAVLLVAI
jgi:hypothetical protein